MTTRSAVALAYAAQGLGYATVVTALPSFKQRQGIDDTAVSLIVLLVCVTAAAGSVLAERVATRRGSRTALLLGLALQALALPVVALATPMPLFVAGFALYGLGLGTVDAAAGIQGVLVQHRLGRPVMSGFFACYTAAAAMGALLMSAVARTGAAIALLVAAVALAGVALGARRHLIGTDLRLATPGPVPAPRPLPARGIWLFGGVVLAAFVVDSAVSTWSTVYLHDVLLASATVAPLGYAAYQAAVLVTRLAGDRLVSRAGRPPVVLAAAVLAALGLSLTALVPAGWSAIAGFAAAGVGVGALVPMAFSAAGELDPGRVDEVIARINLFNYAGAVLGAVLVGLLADRPGLGLAFLLPALLVAPVSGTARRFVVAAPPEAEPVGRPVPGH
jgi:MFS family permease